MIKPVPYDWTVFFFNEDGTIKKVIPTLRGAGLTNANQRIQIDRNTQLSQSRATIDFLDTLDRFKGWKTLFTSAGAWVQYNSVDFGKKGFKNIVMNAQWQKGGVLEIRVNSIEGPIVAEVQVGPGKNWKTINKKVLKVQTGVQHLFVISKTGSPVAVDWLSFQ